MKQKIKTGILMTALAVGSLHIVNRCAQAFATVKNLLDKHKGAFYDWRFGQIYYTKTGSGDKAKVYQMCTEEYGMGCMTCTSQQECQRYS